MKTPQHIIEALEYCRTHDLTSMCRMLCISVSGNRPDKIVRIIHKLNHNEELVTPRLPLASRAQHGVLYPIARETLIVKGGWKGMEQVRDFFKKEIGSHFHFTAKGCQFIQRRWRDGNPPTYQEYIDEWIAEHKRSGGKPKAFDGISTYRVNQEKFKTKYKESNPKAIKTEIDAAWYAFCDEQIRIAQEYVRSQLEIEKPKKHPLWGE